jgi:hypothetical protein
MSYRECVMTEIKQEFIFVKPLGICKDLTDWEKNILSLEKLDFSRVYKDKILTEIESYGLTLRLAKLSDIDSVYDFIMTRFHEEYLEDVSKYDIFRFIKYGHGLIVENTHREIIGCLFEVGYGKYPGISYSIRLGIDESLKGKGLGRLLTVYSCLLAMESESRMKIGLIDYNNFVSLHIHVNQAGWLIDTFYDNLNSLGLSFEFSLPLTPEGLLENRIDLDKLQTYIAEHQEGIDYLLIKSDDIETIKSVYQNLKFKIVAIIPTEQKDNSRIFFALPVTILYKK